MAKLTIKGKSIDPRDLDIRIDGVKIDKLVSLELNLLAATPNECSISFYPDDIHVDAEVQAALEAKIVKERE